MVARYLAGRGYERFLFIGKEYDRKYVGFRRALTETGQAATNIVYQHDGQMKKALEACAPLSGQRLAVFAGNDIYALRILSLLRELHIAVPGQAGVIGFDDTMMSRYLHPSLSSVSQPIARMAQEAVTRLLYRIEHPGGHPLWDLPLRAMLVPRESA